MNIVSAAADVFVAPLMFVPGANASDRDKDSAASEGRRGHSVAECIGTGDEISAVPCFQWE